MTRRVCEYCGVTYASALTHVLDCCPVAYGDHDTDIF